MTDQTLSTPAVSCSLRSIRLRHGNLSISADLTAGSLKYVKTILSYQNKLNEDATSFDFRTDLIADRKSTARLQISLNLKNLQLKSLYWHVYIILEDPASGEITEIPVYMDTRQRLFHKFLYNGAYHAPNGFSFYPFYTGDKTLAFAYRERSPYDGTSLIYKEMFAVLLYRFTRCYWKKQHICLICEKFSSMAQDNGYYFFKHCMENDEQAYLNKKILYIIDKKSPDYLKVAPYGKNIVPFMSLRHMCCLLAADLIISSDSKYHAYATQCRHSIFNRYIKKKKSVFLQHGVTALKRVDSIYGKGNRSACDLFIVTNTMEEKIILDNFGYEPAEIANTGFARWDVLKDHSQESHNILIMPTWRNWLDSVSDEAFENSAYFRNYMQLLNSGRFSEILEKYDLQIYFYLHAKFQSHLKTFHIASDRIHVLSFGDTPVNEMLMKCRMLITDYSSVCWDMLYQNKPTLFYQFDLDQYNEAHGSYIDMHKDLFGDRAETSSKLFDLIEKAAEHDFALKPAYARQRSEYFQFKDQQHSRQICEAIKHRFC